MNRLHTVAHLSLISLTYSQLTAELDVKFLF